MADKKEIFQKVAEAVADELNIDVSEIKEDSRFVEDLGADSLDQVELIMKLEENFDIEIPEEDAEKIKTVGDAVNYIAEKLG